MFHEWARVADGRLKCIYCDEPAVGMQYDAPICAHHALEWQLSMHQAANSPARLGWVQRLLGRFR